MVSDAVDQPKAIGFCEPLELAGRIAVKIWKREQIVTGHRDIKRPPKSFGEACP